MERHPRPSDRRAFGTKATIIDVARRAGVSFATVSRVLTGGAPASPGAKQAVHRAAADLGYRRDGVASGLRTGTTSVLGLVCDDLRDPMVSGLVGAIDKEALAAGFAILLAVMGGLPTDDVADVDEMVAQRVDGLILATSHPSEAVYRHVITAPAPWVMVNNERHTPDGINIGSDGAGGSALIAGHLADLGHREVAYVDGPPGSPHSRVRSRAFGGRWLAAGRRSDAIHPVPGDGTPESGVRAVSDLLLARWQGTAIACYNDRTAIGVIQGLATRRIRVPEDVSVTGFDGLPLADWTYPPLTTVRQPLDQIAALAVQTVVARLRGEPPLVDGSDVRLPMTREIRASTAPPARRLG
jgi:LacI family transcriptional regulator